MAGPYASLTSPYAPNHMDSALRIADLIAQQGRSAAQSKYANRLMVSNLISGGAKAVGSIFGARDEAKKTAAENAQIAEAIASGKPVDLAKLVQTFGLTRAKEIYSFTEAALAKQKAATEQSENTASAQAFVQSVLDDPTASPQVKAAAQLWGKTGGKVTPPAFAMPDAKAAADALAKKQTEEERAFTATLGEAMKHGMSQAEVQQAFISKFGKPLPKEFFAPEVKPDLTTVRVPGPGGTVVTQGFTPAQMQAGVTTYQEPKTGGDSSDVGWSIKEVVDLATGQPRMVRVNSRSGEVQPINLPGGLQSTGGAAGAKLTGAQQDDLTTMETVLGLS